MDEQEKLDLVEDFKILRQDENTSYAIAAMKALMQSYERDTSTTTMQEFIKKIREARQILQASTSYVSVRSGCELLVRFMTFSHPELEQASDFVSCRNILLSRGASYVERMQMSRDKVVETSRSLIKDDMVLLTHARSRNVLAVMTKASQRGIHFKVYVTEAQPSCEGRKMADELKQNNIQCTLILDSAAAYIMEKVNAVVLGAEGVCENGGIINRIGTCNIASLANLKNKPVYVFVESFKFIRLIPLNNSSLPKQYLYPVEVLESGADLDTEHPLVDYTSPLLITLLYTDLGILPTSAITEHLIKLYT